MNLDEANTAFWNELCGTGLARSLGITELNADALSRFDGAYFAYYPYLLPLIEHAGVERRTVLEIGVGFGSVGQYVATRCDYYHAVDIAEAPVVLLRQRLEFLGLKPNGVLQGSALDLPYPDETFDTVISIGALHHTGNLPRALSEVRRVLRPGGHALVMVYNRDSARRLTEVAKVKIASALGRTRANADERLRGMYDQRTDGSVAPHTDFLSAADARRLFRDFRGVTVQRRNFDDYVVGKVWLRRAWFLGGVDRLLGLDLYITALK